MHEPRIWAAAYCTGADGVVPSLCSEITHAPFSRAQKARVLTILDDCPSGFVRTYRLALFYTEQIRWDALAVAALLLIVLGLAIRRDIRNPVLYAVLFLCAWLAIFTSGVHATVAGILVVLLVPVRPRLAATEFLERASAELDALRASELTQESVLRDEAQLDALVALDDAATDMRPPDARALPPSRPGIPHPAPLRVLQRRRDFRQSRPRGAGRADILVASLTAGLCGYPVLWMALPGSDRAAP